MFKIKVKSLIDPECYITKTYIYKGNPVSEPRIIEKYDKESERFWTNLGTYISLNVLLDQLKSGNIILI